MIVISSFPEKRGEVAVENAVARYTKLLVESFPKDQKVVVLCEKRGLKMPFLVKRNILVVPSYDKNSLSFLFDLVVNIFKFNKVKNISVQFEFSVFGGKVMLPQLMILFAVLRVLGKNVSVMFHQVTVDLSELSGHLGISKNNIKIKFLNVLLRFFYYVSGSLINRALVHDSILKNSLAKYVNGHKIFVIPHGTGRVRPAKKSEISSFKREYRISRGNRIILVFGYHSWYKGTDWIVSAADSLKNRNYKFILAGGESPTLKTTKAYKIYFKKLSEAIKSTNAVISTGFLPEKDVASAFGAADVVVFPYRARMSASGALSLAFSYGKKILVSNKFSENLFEQDVSEVFKKYDISIQDVSFSMKRSKDFSTKLQLVLSNVKYGKNMNKAGIEISDNRNWQAAGLKYIQVVSREGINFVPFLEPTLAYAKET